jgi:hypothetical protein
MPLFYGSKVVLGALGIAACLVATAAPASAGGDGAAGLIGGLAAGAIIGGAIASQHPGYYAPGYAPAYGYPPPYGRCWFARQRVYNSYGQFVGFRRVRMCR